MENKHSNNKDSYYWKDNTKGLETPYEYEVKTPPPTDHPNTPSQNHDYLNSTPEEQIYNIKAELVALKFFVVEQIYIPENALKKRKFHQRAVTIAGGNFLPQRRK